MKQIDKFKTTILNINNPAEMAGYLDGVRVAAALYCSKECPEEVYIEDGKVGDLTIYGMINYLQSEVVDENIENFSV